MCPRHVRRCLHDSDGRPQTTSRARIRDCESDGARPKGQASLLLYVVAVLLAFVSEWISIGIYVLVALIWFIPDRRIERALSEDHGSHQK